MSKWKPRGRRNGKVNPYVSKGVEGSFCKHRNCWLEEFEPIVKATVQGKSSQEQNDKHRGIHTAHLVDVFQFVYNLADDWLGGLVASGLGPGM